MRSETVNSWVKWITIYALFGLTSTVFTLLSSSVEDADTGERIMEAAPLWYNLYCASFILVIMGLVATRINNIIYLLYGNLSLILLLVYMLASGAWSLDAYQSFVEVTKTFIAVFFGLYIAERFSDKEILSMLAITMGIIVVSSFLIGVFIPDYGMDDHGCWRGAYTHKNHLATGMNIGFIIFAMASVTFKKFRKLNIGFAILAAILVFLSQSGTGLVILALMIASPFYLPYLRQSTFFVLTSAALVGSVFGLAYQLTGGVPLYTILLDALGKDATLTGRTEAWDGIFYSLTDYRSSHIYFGYGAQPWGITPGGDITTALYGAAPDNVYIDVLIRFGLVGSFLHLLVLGKALVLSLQQLKSNNLVIGKLFIVIMLILILNGISESLDAVHFLWMLFAVILASPYIRHDHASEVEKGFASI